MEQEQKACQFCAEMIQAAAKKCRHCGEFFSEQSREKGLVRQLTRKQWNAVVLIGSLLVAFILWSKISDNWQAKRMREATIGTVTEDAQADLPPLNPFGAFK